MKHVHLLSSSRTLIFAALLSQPLLAEIDENSNKLSDVWEKAHGSGLVPSGDPDGDGFSNIRESIAGTDPWDSSSYPKIDQIIMGAQKVVTTCWATVPGIHYQTLVSPDLLSWKPVGSEIIGAGVEARVSLNSATTFTTGGVFRSRWNEVGISFSKLTGYVASGTTPPTSQDRIESLNIPQSVPDEDSYGQWIRGYIIAPETGAYIFQIASNDTGEFFLSTDRNTANKRKIASVNGSTKEDEWTKYSTQTSTSINLTAGKAYYFEILHQEGSGSDHVHVAWKRPSMAVGTRETIAAPYLSSTGESLTDLQASGKRLFFRLEVSQKDSDGDGVSDYEESVLGLNMTSTTTIPRVEDGISARQTLASPSIVTVGVSSPRAYESPLHSGEFIIFRTGGIGPITVPYSLSGTAVSGTDYQASPGTVRIPGGVRSVSIPIVPIADGVAELSEDVTVTLQPGSGYKLGSPSKASISIDDAADVLYVAQLRPLSGSLSGGSGTASVRSSGNSLTSKTSITFSGLSKEFASAEIFSSSTGTGGPTVYTFPSDLSSNVTWNFDPVTGFSRRQILSALKAGNLWVRIITADSVEPEITGQLLPTPAWQIMPAISTPPVAPSLAASTGDAARFLTQATFGPSSSDLTALKSKTFASWINTQLGLPATLHSPLMKARRTELLAVPGGNDGFQTPRNEAWWQHSLTAPDQLRQRMAFALSQIVVISQKGVLDGDHEATTLYYDMLLKNAFGNYRDLLEDVTLSPIMGTYLSMIRNRKPDPVVGREPDENYAREIMQLFSVGLNMLHPDGSLILDSEGMPIPTYTQDDIVGLAHIFTGWGPHFDPLDPPRYIDGKLQPLDRWFLYGRDDFRKMSFYPDYHDTGDHTILGGVKIPAGTDGKARFKLALDTIFNHPNLGPFLARQLIQKFVTSNPSPGYIYRVATVFNNDGSGKRGNLGATIRAVLLDYEARSPIFTNSDTYGKPAEPLLRFSRVLRVVPSILPRAAAGDPRYYLNLQWSVSQQAPLLSPSVFNFFQPGYSNPGTIARNGLLSPEFQILGESSAVSQVNVSYTMIFQGTITFAKVPGSTDRAYLNLDYSSLVAILDTPGLTVTQAQNKLINHLDERLLFGKMSSSLRTEILQAFANLPSGFGYTADRQVSRAQVALYLTVNSPEYFVQR